jgi:hypothetical protein
LSKKKYIKALFNLQPVFDLLKSEQAPDKPIVALHLIPLVELSSTLSLSRTKMPERTSKEAEFR